MGDFLILYKKYPEVFDDYFKVVKNKDQMIYCSSKKIRKTNVVTEKHTEELNSLTKFDQYINLCACYHLNR